MTCVCDPDSSRVRLGIPLLTLSVRSGLSRSVDQVADGLTRHRGERRPGRDDGCQVGRDRARRCGRCTDLRTDFTFVVSSPGNLRYFEAQPADMQQVVAPDRGMVRTSTSVAMHGEGSAGRKLQSGGGIQEGGQRRGFCPALSAKASRNANLFEDERIWSRQHDRQNHSCSPYRTITCPLSSAHSEAAGISDRK